MQLFEHEQVQELIDDAQEVCVAKSEGESCVEQQHKKFLCTGCSELLQA